MSEQALWHSDFFQCYLEGKWLVLFPGRKLLIFKQSH